MSLWVKISTFSVLFVSAVMSYSNNTITLEIETKFGRFLPPEETVVDLLEVYSESNEDVAINGSNATDSNNELTLNEWVEHWGNSTHPHDQNLTLVHLDDHLAVYYDDEMDKSITWPFEPLSSAWKYIKETFGSFGPDPHLYVILHSRKHEHCFVGLFWNERYDSRNLIDCGTLESGGYGWAIENSENFEILLNALAHVVRNGAKGVRNTADSKFCGEGMTQILLYDLYIHLRNETDDDVSLWKERQLTNEIQNGGGGGGCFKNWVLPIYEMYGNGNGSSVLNKFYSLTHSFWPLLKSNNGSREFWREFEWEELVHFWSGAVDRDLQPLANASYGWGVGNERKLAVARLMYPLVTYPVNVGTADTNLNLVNQGSTFGNNIIFTTCTLLLSVAMRWMLCN